MTKRFDSGELLAHTVLGYNPGEEAMRLSAALTWFLRRTPAIRSFTPAFYSLRCAIGLRVQRELPAAYWARALVFALLPMLLPGARLPVTRAAVAPGQPAPILSGVAADNAGHVYVADAHAGRLYVLSPDLRLLAIWTVPRFPGSSPVYLTDVAAGRNGLIYVTDLNDHLFVLNRRGEVQARWGSPGNGPGEFQQAAGVAVRADGALLVADHYNHRIQVLSSAGKPLEQWQLYSPREFPGGPCGLQHIAIAPDEHIYVTDDCYGRVFKLTRTGRVLQIWGQRDHGPGEFSLIGGVAVGPSGNVFVGEVFRILKFAPDGRLLQSIRKPGYPGYPFSPNGIAVDNRGIIYAADAENYRVFELAPSGQTLAVRCLRPGGCHGGYASNSSS